MVFFFPISRYQLYIIRDDGGSFVAVSRRCTSNAPNVVAALLSLQNVYFETDINSVVECILFNKKDSLMRPSWAIKYMSLFRQA